MSAQSSNILRGLKALSGPFPTWDTQSLPDRPTDLFLDWMKLAIEMKVKEPHAMTISTVDSDGFPDARVLIIKEAKDDSFYFATGLESQKGQHIQHNPKVALTFYWPELGRQIRIRGIAEDMGLEAGAIDLRRRSPIARAVAMTERQSQPLASEEELESSVAMQEQKIEQDPDVVTPNWRLFAVHAQEIEFWQADPDRKHTRYQYILHDGQWTHQQLWP
ncbi:pyridoxal 5'-phosphate synthase [Paenibacillus sp. KACC 21273]|uniref:pyridoxine/pyridoxamine 5'-phosphate oxidase n=1 Tax=Paenibacillus sp. KACC 21273 TaxID=3025665 RepID=UPI0023658FAE|nr:pyridoxal 5'-phosphate synthase [Paenibacillus sp. KACC 21273]WDF51385.1 pyridoxal 5'-phosphate synthase [Paenibacillus sp. KACC 21273]